jgi:hypothetical protein
MIAREFPVDQVGLCTISRTIALISGVRWFSPSSSTVFHATGLQVTEAKVVGLDEMFFVAVVNFRALPLASPLIVREAGPLLGSSST